eukprot:308704_1
MNRNQTSIQYRIKAKDFTKIDNKERKENSSSDTLCLFREFKEDLIQRSSLVADQVVSAVKRIDFQNQEGSNPLSSIKDHEQMLPDENDMIVCQHIASMLNRTKDHVYECETRSVPFSDLQTVNDKKRQPWNKKEQSEKNTEERNVRRFSFENDKNFIVMDDGWVTLANDEIKHDLNGSIKTALKNFSDVIFKRKDSVDNK